MCSGLALVVGLVWVLRLFFFSATALVVLVVHVGAALVHMSSASLAIGAVRYVLLGLHRPSGSYTDVQWAHVVDAYVTIVMVCE